MTPRKAILKALNMASDALPPGSPVRPPSLPGYAERPERYQQAVNELLQERLVEGRKDAEGHLTIAINEHRRREVDRMLRPLWARPMVWTVVALLAVVGAGLAVISGA